MRNKDWRKDLVKRYWINNSDDSGSEENEYTENKNKQFKEEFFPV